MGGVPGVREARGEHATPTGRSAAKAFVSHEQRHTQSGTVRSGRLRLSAPQPGAGGGYESLTPLPAWGRRPWRGCCRVTAGVGASQVGGGVPEKLRFDSGSEGGVGRAPRSDSLGPRPAPVHGLRSSATWSPTSLKLHPSAAPRRDGSRFAGLPAASPRCRVLARIRVWWEP